MSLITTMFESFGTVQVQTVGRDNRQGVTGTPWTNKPGSVNLPCSVQKSGTQVSLLYAQRETVVGTTVYFAQDPQAQVNDRFFATEARTGKTTYYLVRGEAEPVMRGALWGMDCEEIRAPT